MIAIHPRTKDKINIKDLKIVNYKIFNNVGVEEDTKCIEFIIIGNNSEWVDWSLYYDFKKRNPHIDMLQLEGE